MLPLDGQLALAQQLGAFGYDEATIVANYVLTLALPQLAPQHYAFLDSYLETFRGWGSTDDFAIGVLQPLLRRFPAETSELLRRWAASPNRWKRRASMVTFTRKIGASGEYTDMALELCDSLVLDTDDLVQKAVGWALKDVMRGAHDRVLAYVESLRARGVAATITLYAIRDLRGEERARVLAVRSTSKA